MESEVAVSESNFGGSFLPSIADEPLQNEVVDDVADFKSGGGSIEQLDQIQSSALETRQQEAAAIRDLERDMTDLLDIHQDLNTHIHTQGEDIDRIELQTEKAGNRVAKGQESTKTAVVINRESKTLLWLIIGITGGVIGVILVIVIILIAVLTSL